MLCRTACTCAWRRLRAALRANPLIAATALAALAGLPLLALAAGRASAPVLSAAADDEALARGLALAVVAAATAVGIAFASLAPTRALLGTQLEPAPLGALAAFIGLTLLPIAVVAVPVAALALAFAVPAFGEISTAFAFLTAVGAALACGAAATEAAIGAARGSGRAAAAAVGVAGAWLVVGAAGGAAALGPAAVLGQALREPRTGGVAVLVALSVGALGLWGAGAAIRPPARERRGSVELLVPLPRLPGRAAATVMIVRLVRNAEARRHMAAGICFAFAGALTIRGLVGAGPAPPYFAASVALLAAAAVPLIAAGLRRDGRWLIRAAPVAASRLAAADAAAAAAVGFAVVVVALSITAPFGRLGPGALLMLETTAALVLGAAAASGAVLPWRGDRVLEQLASYTLLAVVAAALTVALGRAAAAAPAFGLSEGALAAVAAHLVLAGGIGVAAVLEE